MFDRQIYIKDVKSSNGTFINGDRLSLEGVESEPFELKSEDMVVSTRDYDCLKVMHICHAVQTGKSH